MTIEERLDWMRRLWGWEPHGGQMRLLRAMDEARVVTAVCGRRWGKTECVAADIALRVLAEPDLGQVGIAPTRDQAAILWESVADKVLMAQGNRAAVAAFPHIGSLLFRETPYPRLLRKSDHALVFSVRTAGRTGRNLRGRGTTRKMARFRVILDERAFVPDKAVESALLPMLATTPGGGQLVQVSSPWGRRGGFYRDFLRGEHGEAGYRSLRLPSSQNPLVDQNFLARMQEEMTDAAFRAEFLAEFTDTAGQVFPSADIEGARCDDDYPDKPVEGALYMAGVDFGRRTDWTCVCVVAVDESGNLRLVHFERWRLLGWQAQCEKVADVLARWKVKRAATDATGIGDVLTEDLSGTLVNRGLTRIAVDPFVFTAPSKGQLIDGLALALSRGRLQFPAHPVLLSELGDFSQERTETGHTRMEAATGHDDSVCALALSVWAAGRASALRRTRAAASARGAAHERITSVGKYSAPKPGQIWREEDWEELEAGEKGVAVF